MSVWSWLLGLVGVGDVDFCQCGHEHSAHRHYRRGNDCAFCDCESYRPATR
jgi:hypothetical protein